MLSANEPIDPTTPMRTVRQLDDIPENLSALPALWQYAMKWWDDESTNGHDAAFWSTCDLLLAIEQAEKAFPAGPNSHTLPLVLRYATIMESVLAEFHERDKAVHKPNPSTADDPAEAIMPSWREGDPRELYGVLINACTNLARTINDHSNDSAAVGRKAAVVGVYALMLADLNGALGDWPDWQTDRVRRIGRGAPPDLA